MKSRIVKQGEEAPNPNQTPEMAEVAAKANAVVKSRIRKQGKALAGMPSSSAVKKGEAGLYEVIHGRINFGYDPTTGESEIALPGAIVELTSEEAARMLDENTVKKAS